MIETLTKDVSAGGLRIMMNKPIPVGTKLNIFLSLSEDEKLEAEGEVVRIIPPEEEHDKYEVAIRYSDINNGGILHFEMGDKPNKERGVAQADKPFSLSGKGPF